MILQNGKRIDGCSDTVPVGTLQPYLGLVPPKGYLVCQGQLVSKITYSKLYEICGDTFGISTETHFYLPDLRGKTLAGYDENDTTMNTIGKLLGQKNHVHTTGNHTLTANEMPSHYHTTRTYSTNYNQGVTIPENRTYAVSFNTDAGNWAWSGSTAIADAELCNGATTDLVGGSQAHNHGDTGSNTNYQPTITINWIVKAVMLIPDYIIVEDALNSDSVVDALSARQGKLLNEKFEDYATKTEMIQYLPLSGGTISGNLTLNGEENISSGVLRAEKAGLTDYSSAPLWANCPLRVGTVVTGGSITYSPGIGFVEYQEADGTLYMRSRRLFWASSSAVSGYLPEANKGYEIIHTGNRETLLYSGNWVNGTERPTLDSINGKTIYKKYVTGNFNGLTNVILATGVDQYIDATITIYRDGSGQWHRANAHVMAIGSVAEPMSHIDCIFQKDSSIMTYTNNTVFTNAPFRGFIYYTKL